MRESAVGAGRVAFTGLPLDTSLNVTVDALVSIPVDTAEPGDTADSNTAEIDVQIGRAGPITLEPKTQWLETNWSECEGPCEVCQSPGSLNTAGTRTSTLAIRFLD